MADRFPSIEELDAGQTTTANVEDSTGDDFLSREEKLFDQEFKTGNETVPSVQVEDGDDDDLLGGGQANGDEDIGKFQQSFPAVDSGNERMAPGGSITGTGPNIGRPTSPYAPFPTASDEPEPDVIREWRERRDTAIQTREDAATARKEQNVKDARTAIDEFYENYNNKTEKARNTTRKDAEEFLANRESTTSGGTSWERIGKLVDLKKTGGTGAPEGKKRFRELLGSLAKDESAPGAKGY